LTPGDRQAVELLQNSLEGGGGQAAFVGLGRSMEPLLLPGDLVRIVRISGHVRVGWIMVFSWREGIVTHRVIKTTGEEFWARGDSCADKEGPVPIQDAIGRVVAYRRDGQWHSLEGDRQAAIGLAVNILGSGLRQAARRWPRLRKMVEVDLLGARAVRRIYSRVGRWVFGDIVLARETSRQAIIGALDRDSLPLTQEFVSDAEARIEAGELKLIVARSAKRGRVGGVALGRAYFKKGLPTGYVSSLLVSLGVRGLGVGRRLLAAAEAMAREDGLKRLVALVAPENVRSLELFESRGFRRVSGKELAGRSAEERESVPGDKLLLEKGLGS
jgi:ribosomal protein S18 acetylase RimI-like enzyme